MQHQPLLLNAEQGREGSKRGSAGRQEGRWSFIVRCGPRPRSTGRHEVLQVESAASKFACAGASGRAALGASSGARCSESDGAGRRSRAYGAAHLGWCLRGNVHRSPPRTGGPAAASRPPFFDQFWPLSFSVQMKNGLSILS